MAKMTAAQAAVWVMEKEGITQAFGIPGAAINPLYSALRKQGTIGHILARHVEGASHMAEGYTRAAAGNIGVCIGTSGPAGTDMITGLYSAWADSIPILCITGQAPRARLYKEDFQAVDIESISKPVTKWSVTVREPAQVPGTCAGSRTVTDHLVTGLEIDSMSTAWKSSLYSRARGAWPVMHRMGMESACAEYRPVIMSVPAGPEVPMQTPMFPGAACV